MSEPSFPSVCSQLATLETIPCVPSILVPVLRHLSEPMERIEVQRVVELISSDKSLTAQTLRLANSPLFGHSAEIDTVGGAVLTLGLARMRTIATTCCMLRLVPAWAAGNFDPRVFWEHSLGCALVARKLARRVGYSDPEKAYLAGLLHDIGFIVAMLLFPHPFRQVLQRAQHERIAVGDVEQEILGFNHSQVGEMLASRWLLGGDLQDAIRHHHKPDGAQIDGALVGLVAIGDLLCRTSGLGYGYDEQLHYDLKTFAFLKPVASKLPKFNDFDWAEFLSGLHAYAKEVRKLVSVIYRTN